MGEGRGEMTSDCKSKDVEKKEHNNNYSDTLNNTLPSSHQHHTLFLARTSPNFDCRGGVLEDLLDETKFCEAFRFSTCRSFFKAASRDFFYGKDREKR
jgi:hypothetical protein